MMRHAIISDLPAIVAIHNQAIAARFQTAFTEPNLPENRLSWFHEHNEEKYPLFVYETDGAVVGYLTLSDYRQGRGALRFAAEISYFIHSDHQGQGIGSQLVAKGIAAAREIGYTTLLAIILEPNIASARLLEKHGFEKWAYLPSIADFDGIVCSQVYYGLKL